MKNIFKICVPVVLFFLMSEGLFAQNGGFGVSQLAVSDSIAVGTTASSTVLITDKTVTLPPVSNMRISEIQDPQEGMLIYSSESDVLKVYDGTKWKSIVGTPPAEPNSCETTYQDIDSNEFEGVLIGDQCWMDRNLEVTRFPDGAGIPLVTINAEWDNLKFGHHEIAYCIVNNNQSLGYGALYTWDAALTACPEGWHLPTNAEWQELFDWLGEVGGVGYLEEGLALKSLSGWKDNGVWGPGNGTDDFNFSGLPAGGRNIYGGDFFGITENAYWWSATAGVPGSFDTGSAWNVRYNSDMLNNDDYAITSGSSVRCIKNEE